MTKNIITWDLGATKCAAAVVVCDEDSLALQCKKSCSIKLADTTSLNDLISQIESQLDFSMSDANAICIGAAGQYNGEELELTNGYPYRMNFSAIAKQHHWPKFAVLHDYAPVVCATFTSYMQNEKNIKTLNSNTLQPYGRRVALGVGTGLGMKDGVLFENGDFWLGKNEIGHIGISTPPSVDNYYFERHKELIRFLHPNQSITFESILSGPGIARLYQFFYPESGKLTPDQVGIKMKQGEASDMLSAFAWYLGLLTGTVQLTFMPEGGIWITGGVALHHMDVFNHPEFIKGIHASPAYLQQRSQYPLGILCNQEHALIGGAYYAMKRLMV